MKVSASMSSPSKCILTYRNRRFPNRLSNKAERFKNECLETTWGQWGEWTQAKGLNLCFQEFGENLKVKLNRKIEFKLNVSLNYLSLIESYHTIKGLKIFMSLVNSELKKLNLLSRLTENHGPMDK